MKQQTGRASTAGHSFKTLLQGSQTSCAVPPGRAVQFFLSSSRPLGQLIRLFLSLPPLSRQTSPVEQWPKPLVFNK